MIKIILLYALIAITSCYDWNKLVEDKKSVTLKCHPTKTKVEKVTWILPDVSVTGSKLLVSAGNPVALRELDEATGDLKITEVNSRIYGVYICGYKNGDLIQYHKWGLNVYGPPKKTGIDKYHTNILSGAIPAAVFLGAILILAIFWNMRYIKNKEDDLDNKDENQVDAYELFRSSKF